jgi:hypothetical protein
MPRIGFIILAAVGLALAGASMLSQQSMTAKAAGAPKVGKDEKLCRYKFSSGEIRTWVCKKEEPCCAWDAINYVKCGSAVFKCL